MELKTYTDLFKEIVSFENLEAAYRSASKLKRYRTDVLKFTRNLEENLINIQNELIHKTYEVGRYREFYVYEPKKRLIMALPFKDRVVQWAIYRVIEPLLDRQFIFDSYACRQGKGVQKAADRMQYWIRRLWRQHGNAYYLKLDISKYFYRVDHDVLLSILERKFADPDLMWLLEKIVRSEHTEFGIPLGDHGFDQGRIEGIGMPIGNLSSQLFANLYLNELDQFAKHQLRLKCYIRYMDDIVALHPSKELLHQARREIERFLEDKLRLTLNNKTAIRPIHTGVEFCGFRIWGTHRKIRKGTVRKIKGGLRFLQRAYARGDKSLDEVNSAIQSYIGYLKHADTFNLRKRIFHRAVFTKGNPENPSHFCQKS
ncbi:reverse transcriptase/maturase family protein [Paenibacillus konkukensis]|uniref:reverse transcriptase/maturase family protein n=1 Tax=Paenibacillus konkukensis TaxID=2020716 RepID=UPI00201DC61E|nr:reverse transcriptase/maturase family protein [Paenibacillus konkukensis]